MLKRLHLADAGGDLTSEGGRVRTGLLYRSSAIHKLLPAERARLEALGLKHIVDLREPSVIARRPDALQVERVTRLPVGFGVLETVRPRDVLLRRVDWQVMAHPRLYADVLEENGPLFKHFLESLLANPTPTLVHCTAGKDRTGMMVAIFQLALGVPPPRIVAGYMSVLPHLQKNFPRSLKALVQVLGGPPLAYSVMPEYMEGMLTHIAETYGGAEGYLQSIRFAQIEALRAKFLE
jgi:protein-tyrosine phosphatase